MTNSDTIILTRRDVRDLLDVDTCIAAVEDAFRAHGMGDAPPPAILAVHVDGGGFHVKAGALRLDRFYYAAKSNGNFPDNPARFGLPTIQGVVILADAERGVVLAVMDSAEITALRTAAASAVAAKHLARADSRVAAIVGCGVQGEAHARALSRVRPLDRIIVYDRDPAQSARLSRQLTIELAIDVQAVDRVEDAAHAADIVATCTTSREPILYPSHVCPGTFIAAAGADNPEKQEIHPTLMAISTIVVDVLDQAATIGDLHHAIVAGAAQRSDARELGAVIAGRAPGRATDEEIIVFDSTGMALQDVAAAAATYRRAIIDHRGLSVGLGDAP